MRRGLSQKPKKIRVFALLLLLMVASVLTLLTVNVKPTQTTVEKQLDAAAFLSDKQ